MRFWKVNVQSRLIGLDMTQAVTVLLYLIKDCPGASTIFADISCLYNIEIKGAYFVIFKEALKF
jgi:hypothetical protein